MRKPQKRNQLIWDRENKLKDEKHDDMVSRIKSEHPNILVNAKVEFDYEKPKYEEKYGKDAYQNRIELIAIANYKKMKGFV